MHPHTHFRKSILPVALLLLGGTAVAAQAQAQDGPRSSRWRPDRELSRSGGAIKEAFRQVVADANRATVKVRSEGKDVALGTVVSADGYVLTKASELAGDAVVVLRDESERPARVVGVAEDHDLAMLKIDAAGLTPIRWADAKNAAVGRWVVTTGMADAPSALGVLSVGRRPIPPRTGRLGVGLADGADRSGARVTEVFPESPAEKAGIKVDDVIARVNDKPVDGREALVATIRSFMPGQEVRLDVRRGAETVPLKARLVGGLGTAARAEMMNQMGGPLSIRNANFPAVLQHDTVLTPAMVGGPLVTLDGTAIGINIARAGRVESYALPADVVTALIPELKSGRHAPKQQDKPTTTPGEKKNEGDGK